MKSHFLTHFFRLFPDTFVSMRRAWMAPGGGPSGGAPGSTPSGAPASISTAPEDPAISAFRLELTKLKNDLDIKGTGGSLMKFAEEHRDDTGDWQKNPQSAIKFFEDYKNSLIGSPAEADKELLAAHVELASGAPGKSLDKLIHALNKPEIPNPAAPTTKIENPEFTIAKEIILQIAQNINARKSAIAEAKSALGDLNENAVNGKIKNFVENAYNTYGRMSTPEKLATVGAIFMFFKMALSDKEGNMVFGPLVKGGVALTLGNLVVQAATGKSAIDHIAEKAGLERFLPTASDQLPEFMKALALKVSRDKGVDINMPSELVAMGKLGEQKMLALIAVYNPAGDSIDPAIFGLRPAKENDRASGDISPKHLYMIVDTLVKKYKTTGPGAGARGDKDAFMLEYCSTTSRHDFTFAETIADLFQAESIRVIHDSMTPDEWEKYKKVVVNDTNDMWVKDGNVGMDRNNAKVGRYGVQFYGVTYLTKQYKSGDGNRYTYQIGDDKRVTVGVKDSVVSRRSSANLLKEYSKKYLVEEITAYGLGSGLTANPNWSDDRNLEWDAGGFWVLKNVKLAAGGPDITVNIQEYYDEGNRTIDRDDFKVTIPGSPSKSANLDKNFATVGRTVLGVK